MKKTFIIFLFAAAALAQKPAAAPQAPARLSSAQGITYLSVHTDTEAMSEEKINSQLENLKQYIDTLDAQVRKLHPGSHIDKRTLQVVTDKIPPATSNSPKQ